MSTITAAYDPSGPTGHLPSTAAKVWTHHRIRLLSPARGRGWVRGIRTSLPPLLASPPSGGEEFELYPDRSSTAGEEACAPTPPSSRAKSEDLVEQAQHGVP